VSLVGKWYGPVGVPLLALPLVALGTILVAYVVFDWW
jgi:hypothetical protein